jgi:hypothetical protein
MNGILFLFAEVASDYEKRKLDRTKGEKNNPSSNF